jgi:GDP-L-fucose synthase
VLESGITGAFNVGRDDDARPLTEIARIACDLVGADTSLIEEVDPPGRQTVVKRLATDKVRALGWRPEVSIIEGMTIVRDWIIEQKAVQVPA